MSGRWTTPALVAQAMTNFLLIAPVAAIAAEPEACARFNQTGITADARMCNAARGQSANAQLEETWRRVAADAQRLFPGSRIYDALSEDQKNWDVWYRSACTYAWAIPGTGEMGGAFAGPACRNSAIEQRIRYLDDADTVMRAAQR